MQATFGLIHDTLLYHCRITLNISYQSVVSTNTVHTFLSFSFSLSVRGLSISFPSTTLISQEGETDTGKSELFLLAKQYATVMHHILFLRLTSDRKSASTIDS